MIAPAISFVTWLYAEIQPRCQIAEMARLARCADRDLMKASGRGGVIPCRPGLSEIARDDQAQQMCTGKCRANNQHRAQRADILGLPALVAIKRNHRNRPGGDDEEEIGCDPLHRQNWSATSIRWVADLGATERQLRSSHSLT